MPSLTTVPGTTLRGVTRPVLTLDVGVSTAVEGGLSTMVPSTTSDDSAAAPSPSPPGSNIIPIWAAPEPRFRSAAVLCAGVVAVTILSISPCRSSGFRLFRNWLPTVLNPCPVGAPLLFSVDKYGAACSPVPALAASISFGTFSSVSKPCSPSDLST